MRRTVVVLPMVSMMMLALTAVSAFAVGVDALKEKVEESLSRIVPLRVVVDDLKVVGADDAAAGGFRKVLSVEPVRFVPPSRAVFSAVVVDEKGRTGTLVCEVKYDTLVDVYVSARPIAKGEVVTKDDFYAVPQRASRVPVGSVKDASQLVGKRMRVSIGKGVVFRKRYLEDGITVRRGQKVKIEIRGGNVVITAPGRLSQLGRIGDVVRVFCEFTRKELSGILVSPRKVVVTL